MKVANFKHIPHMAATVYWEYKPWWTPRRLTTPLEKIEIDRPIFILGVQGGGLTLLTRMLHRDKRVVTIGGGRAYWTGNNEMDKQYIGQLPEDFTLRSPNYQSPTFKRHMTGQEEMHPIFGLERDWVYASSPLLAQYRKTAEDWTPPKAKRLKRAIKESICAYAPDTGQARFLDMSQTFSLKVPLLRRIFPDARFIVQTRNPYAVCLRAARDFRYSWVRKFEADPQTKLLKLKLVAEHWHNTFALAMRDLDDYEQKILSDTRTLLSGRNPHSSKLQRLLIWNTTPTWFRGPITGFLSARGSGTSGFRYGRIPTKSIFGSWTQIWHPSLSGRLGT